MMAFVSIVGRLIVGGLGVAGLIHCYRAWKSGRAPLMVGEADAKYWGARLPLHRTTLLLALAFFSTLFVLGATFG